MKSMIKHHYQQEYLQFNMDKYFGSKAARAIKCQWIWCIAFSLGSTEATWISGIAFAYFFLDWGLSLIEH